MNAASHDEEIEYLQVQLARIHCHEKRSTTQWHLSQSLLHESEVQQAFFDRLQEAWHRLHESVCEANTIAKALQRTTTYQLVVRIPPSYLKPNERSIENLCELAIQIEQAQQQQIWTVETFEVRLGHMRELYKKWQKLNDVTAQVTKGNDPFIDGDESNQFLGVSNICLKALFYHTKLDYTVPVISPQGQICGSLHVTLDQTGRLPMAKYSDFQINSMTRSSLSQGICLEPDGHSFTGQSSSETSLADDEGIDDSVSLYNEGNDQITIKFTIKEIRDLPVSTPDKVICRYTFINPKLDQTMISNNGSSVFTFDQEKEYTFTITDHFLSKCRHGALSIEVWYQSSVIPRPIESQQSKELRALGQRWKNVKQRVQYSIEIQELNLDGQWCAVDVDTPDGIVSGGIYRLKQGQSKRLAVFLCVVPPATAMDLGLETIRSVEIGSIRTRKLDAPVQLDSYQDDQLNLIREEWLERIDRRKRALEAQIAGDSEHTEKTFSDLEREAKLLEELVRVTEERNMAELPPIGSGLPGAPAGWKVAPTIEMHRPTVFLHLDPRGVTLPTKAAGLDATLAEERSTDMKKLSLIRHHPDEVGATALWDPSVHEVTAIDQVSPSDTVIYLIVKIVVIISRPARMELVLRKRIAVTMGKTESWWSRKSLKNLLADEKARRTSVVYEVISHIPECVPPTDDLLRDMKASLQQASAIDSLLCLDRLRQEVLLAENSAKQHTLRKSTSAPNIRHCRTSRDAFETIPEVQCSANPSTVVESDEREGKYLASLANNANENVDYSIGDRVIVNTAHQVQNKPGYIRFIGTIHIKHGRWYGVELDEPCGKNDGSLDGHVYFQCSSQHGVFVRRDKLAHHCSQTSLAVRC